MVGTVKNEIGIVFSKENYKVVRKTGKKSDVIQKHNHIGEEIVFTVLNGKVKVTLNDSEEKILEKYDILNFDGENSLSVDFLEDSELLITLIKK